MLEVAGSRLEPKKERRLLLLVAGTVLVVVVGAVVVVGSLLEPPKRGIVAVCGSARCDEDSSKGSKFWKL